MEALVIEVLLVVMEVITADVVAGNVVKAVVEVAEENAVVASVV